MKPKLYRILFPLLFLTISLFPSIRAGAQPGLFAPNAAAEDMIEKVNALRVSKSLAPYEVDPILTSIAKAHVGYISSTGVLTHFDDKGRRPYQRALDAGYSVAGNLNSGGLLTEAIYAGTGMTDEAVIAVWQANAADATALLSENYTDIGVAIGSANGVTYYVLVAASESESVQQTASPLAGTQLPLPGTLTPNTPLPTGEILHTIQKDEALWSVAILYGTTIAELKVLNGLAGDEIFEGQVLVIRRASTETPTPSPVPVTPTLGLSTSTATLPVTPTITLTPTPLPTPPTSMETGRNVVGGIVLAALLAAGLVSVLGRRSNRSE